MKTKIGVLLLALLLAAMAMVPIVSAAEAQKDNSGTIADSAAINARFPMFLQDLKNQDATDEQIAAAIVNYSRISYLDGWTQADDQKYSPLLKQGRSNKSYTRPSSLGSKLSSSLQATTSQFMESAGMTIYEYNYRGFNADIIHRLEMTMKMFGDFRVRFLWNFYIGI